MVGSDYICEVSLDVLQNFVKSLIPNQHTCLPECLVGWLSGSSLRCRGVVCGL